MTVWVQWFPGLLVPGTGGLAGPVSPSWVLGSTSGVGARSVSTGTGIIVRPKLPSPGPWVHLCELLLLNEKDGAGDSRP